MLSVSPSGAVGAEDIRHLKRKPTHGIALGGCPRIRLSNELPLLSFGEILNFPEIKFKIDPIFSVLTL